jgi:hypothetical protein
LLFLVWFLVHDQRGLLSCRDSIPSLQVYKSFGDKFLGGHGSVVNSASFSRIGMADEFAREIYQRQFCVHRRLKFHGVFTPIVRGGQKRQVPSCIMRNNFVKIFSPVGAAYSADAAPERSFGKFGFMGCKDVGLRC